ncbi:MAG TPA: winged helix DNA-binding domain-containing protein [Candidatus Dormibacteraeota bacterium]|nr:winged helix DNA-binding domain-containing protein [Candidatus Dormibacteraeota bacterium]
MFGLQAQVLSAAALGMRARSTGLWTADVAQALNTDRSIVRTWLMRGTLHLVATEDLDLLLGLLGPVFAAGNRARHHQLGLDSDLKRRGVAAIRRILAEGGPLTRYQIVDRLQRRGIGLDPKTQAPIHMIQVAALEGVLCLGPERENGEPTYVLIEDWLAHPLSSSSPAAPGELARRYFAAYGPATPDDLVAWSGLPVAQARSAISMAMPALTQVEIDGRAGLILKDRIKTLPQLKPAAPTVRLLPAFDTYLLGYRSRDMAVPPALERRLQRGGGWRHPAVVVGGRAIGAWALRKTGTRGEILMESLEPMTHAIREGIAAEVADIGRFLGLDLSYRLRSGPFESRT